MSSVDELERWWRFLLGECDDEEQAALEDALFGDEEQLVMVESAEDDLIDAYVRGELPASRRRRFEQHFAVTPAHRARIAFATALAKRSAQSQPLTPPTATATATPTPARHPRGGVPGAARLRRRWMSAAAALVVAGLGGTVGWRLVGGRTMTPVELTLSSAQSRGTSELPTLRVERRPAPLSLILLLDHGAGDELGACVAARYEVTLRGPDATVRTLPASAARARLAVALDGAQLGEGSYEVVARGRCGDGPVRDVAAYGFRVARP